MIRQDCVNWKSIRAAIGPVRTFSAPSGRPGMSHSATESPVVRDLSDGIADGELRISKCFAGHDFGENLDGVVDVNEANVERSKAETRDIRCTKVANDAALDERLNNSVRLVVTHRDLAPP